MQCIHFARERLISHQLLPKIFKKATIVEVTDFVDDTRDRFCALIEASMIDYVIDEKTKTSVSGSGVKLPFQELWHFVRQGDTWVLDQIDQEASIGDLAGMVASSESV